MYPKKVFGLTALFKFQRLVLLRNFIRNSIMVGFVTKWGNLLHPQLQVLGHGE